MSETIGGIGWFKKSMSLKHRVYWLAGKLIILFQFGILFLTIKCILLDIIPTRINNLYIDMPITCIILLVFLLTLRSFLLALSTESAQVIGMHNYLTKETHHHEKDRKKSEILFAFQERHLNKQIDKLKQAEEKKESKKESCWCRRRKQSTIQDSKPSKEIDRLVEKLDDIQKKREQLNVISRANFRVYQQLQNKDSSQNITQEGRMCLSCNIIKGKDDHHCSMCNKCVYRLDHHCFFIGQCVGDYNYQYFISYVFLIYVMSLILLVCLIPDCIELFSLEWKNLSMSILELIILLLFGLLFHVFTLLLLISHMYYISNEITFLENLRSMKKQQHTPLQWVCILLKGQAKQKLGQTFNQRWKQIFGNEELVSIIFPEPNKTKNE